MSIANVITPASRLPRYARSEFPAMFWKENGDNYIAQTEGDVLPGSTPYHPSNAPAKEVVKPAQTSGLALTKQEVIKHLQDGGIEHKATQSHKALHDLLVAGVKNALTEAGIAFDPESNDAATLLELFPKE